MGSQIFLCLLFTQTHCFGGMFGIRGIEFTLTANLIQRQHRQMSKMLPDVTIFTAACYGTHGVHIKGLIIKWLIIRHFATAVKIEIAAVVAGERTCLTPTGIFFTEFTKQINAQQNILLIATYTTENISFSKHGKMRSIDLQTGRYDGSLRIRLVNRP